RAAATQLREHLAQLQPEGAEEAPRPLFMDSEEAQEALDTAAHAVLRESRGSLEHAKEAVIEFVATQWNHDSIRDLPALLAEVRGSLQLAQHPRAAQVLLGCERYVREQLLAPAGVPEWQMLDTLADAITSVDYYLERLSEDPDTDNDGVLGVAEDSVAQLGYPVVPDYPQAAADADAADDSAGHAFEPPTVTDEADIPALSDTVTADMSFPERAGSEISETEDAAYTLENAAGDAPEPEAPALPVYAEDYALADYEPAAATTTSAESSADADVDAPDPEIVEIFIEEAGEVLESLDATLPDWQNNWHDDEAQADIRRAFHTLKGSGRMVGATDIGEFAWAVENMLNRVIDGSRQLDQARVDTVLQARQLAGPLLEAFATGQRMDMREVQALIARAEALAEQQSPALAPEPDHSDRAAAAATEAVEPPLMTEVSEVAADGAGDDEDADDGDDTLLLEIFGGEASAHLEVLEHFIDHARSLAGPADLHDDLQRALHTLKGSAHMAGVKPVAAVVTPVESMIKELRAAQHRADSEIMATLIRLAQFIRAGIAQLEDDPYRPLPGADDFQLEVGELHQRLLTHLEQTEELGAEAVTQQAITRFLTDAVEQLAAVADDLAEWHSGRLSDDRQQSLATTLGEVVDQAETINQPAIVELASALQSTLRQAHEHGALPAGLFVLAEASCESLIDQLDRLAANQQPLLDQHLLNQLQDFRFGPGDADAPADTDTDAGPLAETDDADPAFIGDDSAEHAQEDDSEAAGDGDSNDDQAPEAVAPSLQAIDGAAEQEIDAAPPADEDLDAADTLAIETDDYPAPPVLDSDGELAAAIPLASENGPDTVIYGVDDTPASPPRSEFQPAFGASDDDDDDGVDQEILEIFLEEADDLLESIDAAAHAWSDDRDNRIYLEDLQRLLHTLKGGARLAGLTALGNLSHNFETFLINADQRGAVVDEAFIGKVLAYQDQLLTGVEAVKAGHSDTASDLPTTPEADIPEPSMTDSDADDHAATADAAPFETGDDADDAPSAAPQSAPARSSDNILPFARQADSQEMVPFTAPARELKPGDAKPALAPQSRRGPQEVVKVSAQLLEDLVNLAGETSIARGRAEEQVSELVFALDEMQITVDRLQEQVRRLDMETEAQIVFRQEQLSEGMEDFDPLEFDRYSVLQQLSRSLLESASDLVDIRSTLGERSRDMETVLVQQSRINTELQEGLMRSRMVPFSRMVPRLRRIVRQVSAELDKKVELYIDNAEGELDRSVLERIVAPLEHMLRNAVDHGIESQAQRRAAGKPEEGTIVLSLGREGGEVLLKLADDGAGINLDAVRDKAIERGLMDRSAQLSDREIMQFIMAAGFSTASQVSQISGRGVGMDVVASEIRQLGGSVEIQSEQGQGTTFLVRLPFTVSINRALMVSVAGDVYAIPLNTIEGIVRVSPFELEAYYQPDAPLFEYAGQPYLLRYMGSLLHTSEKPNLEGQSMPLPVLLVRGSDHSVAVQ
ncbi:MAG TPA: Hpt domain-containing protein, partial [Spongiibacteraceae bacterium]|nr:Hpt domain-containing protein [Spongiibacteraceae bacterium]